MEMKNYSLFAFPGKDNYFEMFVSLIICVARWQSKAVLVLLSEIRMAVGTKIKNIFKLHIYNDSQCETKTLIARTQERQRGSLNSQAQDGTKLSLNCLKCVCLLWVNVSWVSVHCWHLPQSFVSHDLSDLWHDHCLVTWQWNQHGTPNISKQN